MTFKSYKMTWKQWGLFVLLMPFIQVAAMLMAAWANKMMDHKLSGPASAWGPLD